MQSSRRGLWILYDESGQNPWFHFGYSGHGDDSSRDLVLKGLRFSIVESEHEFLELLSAKEWGVYPDCVFLSWTYAESEGDVPF